MNEGWEYIALSSVCKVQNGFAFNSKLFNESNNGLPLIRIRDIKRGYSLTYTSEICSDEFFVEDGDMLIGMDGDFNIGEWKGGHALLNQRVCKLIPSEKILAKFIFYFIPEALQRINDKTAFSTVKHLSSKQVNAILLPNLPLSEQQSIVDYLDSAFAKIDAMKTNAEKALNEAKAFFQASLKEMLEPKEGWEEKTIEYFAKIVHGKNQKEVLDSNGSYPIYGSGGNIMGYANAYLCDAGTTILGRKGTIDNPLFINEKFWNVDTAFGIIAKDNCNKKFLYYSIKNIDWAKRNTGTTLPSLTQNVVYNVEMCAPSLSEQQSIVATLDSLKSKVDQLQANFDKISQECDALEQAILRQVFE